jgi:hypothetical protein
MPSLGESQLLHSRLRNDFKQDSIFKKQGTPCKFINFASAEPISICFSVRSLSLWRTWDSLRGDVEKMIHLPEKRNAVEKTFHSIEGKLVDTQWHTATL